MNVVDSCGWLEYFSEGHNVDFFAPVIQRTKSLLVPIICIYEVFKRIYQQRGEDAALQAIALMHQGKVIYINDTIAIYAAKLSVECKIPMADSMILAIGYLNKSTIWTQDKDFKGLKGVKYIESKKK